ncbi:MAG: (d)CMP kinase [Planctomycetota bacterium]
MPIVITIDGPAGSGKSTIAKLLAQKMSFHYLDTGALYRAITLKAVQNKIRLSDKRSIAELVPSSAIKFIYTVCLTKMKTAKAQILLDGKDVSKKIRDPRLTASVSKISSLPLVRKAMVKLQRKLSAGKNIVCEGRDMGSVVFPLAKIKFYLDASIETRAQRRYKESLLLFPRKYITYSQILKEISIRDYRDTHRKIAPLVKPHNSFYIDTSDLTVSQVLKTMLKIINDKLDKK